MLRQVAFDLLTVSEVAPSCYRIPYYFPSPPKFLKYGGRSCSIHIAKLISLELMVAPNILSETTAHTTSTLTARYQYLLLYIVAFSFK
jgi:hypothetical protein